MGAFSTLLSMPNYPFIIYPKPLHYPFRVWEHTLGRSSSFDGNHGRARYSLAVDRNVGSCLIVHSRWHRSKLPPLGLGRVVITGSWHFWSSCRALSVSSICSPPKYCYHHWCHTFSGVCFCVCDNAENGAIYIDSLQVKHNSIFPLSLCKTLNNRIKPKSAIALNMVSTPTPTYH